MFLLEKRANISCNTILDSAVNHQTSESCSGQAKWCVPALCVCVCVGTVLQLGEDRERKERRVQREGEDGLHHKVIKSFTYMTPKHN